MSEPLLAPLPAIELVLTQQTALFFDVDVAVTKRVHSKEIIAVPQLETDHLFGSEQIDKLGLFVAALLQQLVSAGSWPDPFYPLVPFASSVVLCCVFFIY